MAIRLAAVEVPVVPDMRGFHEKIAAEVRSIQDAHINVDIDTGAAALHIAEIRAELEELRDRHVNVDVDDHGSAARTRGELAGIGGSLDIVPLKVAAIGAALIALIPIAAAASAAIAGIGVGVGIGALGAGIGALALAPVFKALSAQKSGGGGAGGASAASALNTQRQAEVALTVAQRNAVQAQKDLTQARLDATQALQDLSDKVIDNGLAQRQAVLDLRRAQTDLAIAKSSPFANDPSNASALEQVQLRYDQAKQSLAELQTAGERLQVQRTAANAAGVDGAANVVAAQNKVVDSQNALVEAQYQVAHSATAAGGATSAYATAVSKLNPAQKQFLAFLQSIRGQFTQLSTAASSGFLPGLQQAITNLLPVLPAFSQFIGKIATAFGDLAVNASKALTGPFWSQFFAFLDRISSPAIGLFGSILGDIFTILASSFQALWPAVFATGQGLDGFLKHIANAIQGGALDGFTNYVKDNLPRVEAFFDSLGKAVGRLVSALAPLGGHLLDGLTKALDGVSKLPPGLLQGGAIAAGGLAVGGKVASVAAPAVEFAVANPEVAAGVAAAAALAAGFTALYLKSKTFHDFINDKLLPVLKRIGQDALDGIRRGLGFVGDAIQRNKPQLTELLHAFEDIADFVVTKVLPILGPQLKFTFEVLGAAIAGVIYLIGLQVTVFNGLVEAAKTVASGLVTAFTNVKDFAENIYNSVAGFVSKAVSAIKGIPGQLLGFGQSFLDAGTTLMNKMFAGFTNAITGSVTWVADFGKKLSNVIIGFINDAIPDHIPVPFAPDIPLPRNLIPTIHDTGGFLPPGLSYNLNKTGQPEPVLNPEQWNAMFGLATDAAQLTKAVASMTASGHAAGSGTRVGLHADAVYVKDFTDYALLQRYANNAMLAGAAAAGYPL